MIEFKPGMQIVYVPNHILETFTNRVISLSVLHHATMDYYYRKDIPGGIEFGFVTSVTEAGVFCRYWSRQYPGLLRTRANSELTPPDNLFHYEFCDQDLVDSLLKVFVNNAGETL